MGAAMEGIVAQQRVAGLQGRHRTEIHLAHQIADTVSHGTEMDGDVGRVGHQRSSRIEESAGKIEPLTDVHRTAALP